MLIYFWVNYVFKLLHLFLTIFVLLYKDLEPNFNTGCQHYMKNLVRCVIASYLYNDLLKPELHIFKNLCEIIYIAVVLVYTTALNFALRILYISALCYLDSYSEIKMELKRYFKFSSE